MFFTNKKKHFPTIFVKQRDENEITWLHLTYHHKTPLNLFYCVFCFHIRLKQITMMVILREMRRIELKSSDLFHDVN